jgi:hypothetical protein
MRFRTPQEQEVAKNLKTGDGLRLELDNQNATSNYAVKAFYHEYHIGFLKEEDAQRFRREFPSVKMASSKIIRKAAFYFQVEVDTAYIKNPCNEIFMQETPRVLPGESGPQTKPINFNQEYQATFSNTTPTTEKKDMNTTINKTVDNNVSMAQNAAILEAGRIVNNQLVKVVSAKAPLMMKGYVDTPFGRVVLANVAITAAQKMRPNDARLARLTQAMGVMAYQEVVQVFDVEKMINDLLESDTVKAALSAVDTAVTKAE